VFRNGSLAALASLTAACAAGRHAPAAVVANGRYMDRAGLDRLSAEANGAKESLQKSVDRAAGSGVRVASPLGLPGLFAIERYSLLIR
jgi:hypothetical protein